MAGSLGARRWAIAEGYIPGDSTGEGRALTSHETVCILNAEPREARVDIMVYFADRDPAGPFKLRVPGRRTLHVRFNDLDDPEPIPVDTDFASVIESEAKLETLTQEAPRLTIAIEGTASPSP